MRRTAWLMAPIVGAMIGCSGASDDGSSAGGTSGANGGATSSSAATGASSGTGGSASSSGTAGGDSSSSTTGVGSGTTNGASGSAGGTGSAGTTAARDAGGTAEGGTGESTASSTGIGSFGDGGRTGDGSSGSVGSTSAGDGGASEGGFSPVPSAGCSKMTARPAGGKVTVTNDHIYDFPASYDGKTPMPLLIALHAAGNPYTQLEGLTNGTRLETNFVRAFPKSAGNEWVYDTDAQKITTIYDDLVANYCVDTSRVFATGHSSGAQMVVQLLCHHDQHFKAASPVAASKYCNSISPIPVMYIQGQMDAMRGNANGSDVVALFTSSNGCGSTTTPDTAVPSCTSTFDRMTVTPGCVMYRDCSKPTIWCSHDDHGYNATDGYEHGWPCFASNAMADFFLGLP